MEEESKGLLHYLKNRFFALLDWVKPIPADPLHLKFIKTFFKGIVALVLLAISPVILIILSFVFFAVL